MKLFTRRLLPLLVTLLPLCATGAAQCVPVPGTGCPGAPALTCLGAPRVGQPAQVSYAAPGLVIAGLFTGAPLLALPAAPVGPACVPGCVLAGFPMFYAVGIGAAQFVFTVPQDPTLVGLSYFGQALYLPQFPAGSCVMASNALQGTIVP